jgi:hypothetical protein
MAPEVALIVVEPELFPAVARPVLELMVAIDVVDELHVTDVVMSPVEVSLNVPVAVN